MAGRWKWNESMREWPCQCWSSSWLHSWRMIENDWKPHFIFIFKFLFLSIIKMKINNDWQNMLIQHRIV
jgi:hypothetical protein